MMKKLMKAIAGMVVLGPALAPPLAHATLESRLGGLAVHDTDLNVTWLANANLMATNTFGLSYNTNYGNDPYGNPSIIYSDGSATWGGAEMWIAAMNAADYLGYNTWELPTTTVPDASCSSTPSGRGLGCTGSMMGNLFYTELGGVAGSSITTTHNASYNLFNNDQGGIYWSGTVYAPIPDYAWYFVMFDGYQMNIDGSNYFQAWPVLPGDVAAVPEADTWAMLLAGLGLVGFVARRRKQT
jgi:MYXO-CTERM domain-containing protein